MVGEDNNLNEIHQVESREWWLSWSAIAVTLVLTAGIAVIAFSMWGSRDFEIEAAQTGIAVRSLIGLVLLFDLYAIYQQYQVHKIRRRWMQREELFRLISENAADMIAVVDASGQRLYNSPSYERILGYTSSELQSTPPWTQIHPDDLPKVRQAAEEAVEAGKGRRIEYRMKHKDGRWILFESTASTVFNSKGEVDKLVIVNRDIEERRRLEDQFRQAQKMEAIGRLSGGVAHDFNNLLGVILGYCEILQMEIREGDPKRHKVDQILVAGKRAAGLTRQLLAFSRQQVLEPLILDLNSVVSNTQVMLSRLIGEDIDLSMNLDKLPGKVRADQSQLEQVIVNLAVNSRDAMPNGGRLCIETVNTDLDALFVKKWPYPVTPGPYVLLSVSDTGAGMDSTTQQRIFEPFFTTKEKGKGTGLGLSMVYGVVKQSGGYIDVYSHVGVGTTFKIYLPRIDGEISVARSQPLETAEHGNATILLVEDEDSLRVVTRDVLETLGYQVVTAAGGKEALEISRKFEKEIDLLLTDVVMPDMNGRTLAEQFTGERPETRILFMSGYTGQAIGVEATFSPGSVFLQKPFTRRSLGQKVLEALHSPSQSPEAPDSQQ